MGYPCLTMCVSVICMCHTSEPFLSCGVPYLKQKRKKKLHMVPWPGSTWLSLILRYNIGAWKETSLCDCESTSSFHLKLLVSDGKNLSFTYWPVVWPLYCQQSPLYSKRSRNTLNVKMGQNYKNQTKHFFLITLGTFFLNLSHQYNILKIWHLKGSIELSLILQIFRPHYQMFFVVLSRKFSVCWIKG